MPTQSHTKQSSQRTTKNEKRNDALNFNIQADVARHDLDGFFRVAASRAHGREIQ
jgi:hypothetical protein